MESSVEDQGSEVRSSTVVLLSEFRNNQSQINCSAIMCVNSQQYYIVCVTVVKVFKVMLDFVHRLALPLK